MADELNEYAGIAFLEAGQPMLWQDKDQQSIPGGTIYISTGEGKCYSLTRFGDDIQIEEVAPSTDEDAQRFWLFNDRFAYVFYGNDSSRCRPIDEQDKNEIASIFNSAVEVVGVPSQEAGQTEAKFQEHFEYINELFIRAYDAEWKEDKTFSHEVDGKEGIIVVDDSGNYPFIKHVFIGRLEEDEEYAFIKIVFSDEYKVETCPRYGSISSEMIFKLTLDNAWIQHEGHLCEPDSNFVQTFADFLAGSDVLGIDIK